MSVCVCVYVCVLQCVVLHKMCICIWGGGGVGRGVCNAGYHGTLGLWAHAVSMTCMAQPNLSSHTKGCTHIVCGHSLR